MRHSLRGWKHSGLDSLSGAPLVQGISKLQLLLQEMQQLAALPQAPANDPRVVGPLLKIMQGIP